MATVVLVDDDANAIRTVTDALPRDMVYPCFNLAALRATLRIIVPDVVVTDVRGIGGGNAAEVVRAARGILDACADGIPLVVHSAMDPREIELARSGVAHTYALPKPCTNDRLRAMLWTVTEGD